MANFLGRCVLVSKVSLVGCGKSIVNVATSMYLVLFVFFSAIFYAIYTEFVEKEFE